MHIADLEEGNLGANGIVGGGIPIAVGAALTSKMMKENYVVLCFLAMAQQMKAVFTKR